MRTALGVAYLIAFLSATVLPFPAFGPIGVLVLVPTALWLASGLRARARRRGDLTDGIVGEQVVGLGTVADPRPAARPAPRVR